MVRAARKLLSAITKVLLIADKVIVKQLLASKDKVSYFSVLVSNCDGESSQEVIVCYYKSLVDNDKQVKQLLASKDKVSYISVLVW